MPVGGSKSATSAIRRFRSLICCPAEQSIVGRGTMSNEKNQSELPKVVIVGGGFGGLSAAKSLRNSPVQVTLLDKNNHHLFQPLLYQVATAGLSPANIAAPIRSVLRHQKNTVVEMVEVTGIDKEKKEVIAGDRKIHYDYLILATGATDSYFGKDEWEEFAPGLKSLTQATRIRRDILTAFELAEIEEDEAKRNALLTFVVIGAGPTGVEMVGAIAELARKTLAGDFRWIDPGMARIFLIEAGPRVLPTFDPSISKQAQKHLEGMGVEVRVGQKVEMADEDGVIVMGARIPSKTLVWAAGVKASPAGKWLGVETDRMGRVKVTPDCSVSGYPEIFVIGDTALFLSGEKPLPGVAQVAIQQGAYVAKAIRNRLTNSVALPPFKYFDKGNMATVGRSFAVVQSGEFKFGGFIAWLAWLAIHILYLITFKNRILVLMQWTWSYLSWAKGARLITGNSPLEPKKLPGKDGI